MDPWEGPPTWTLILVPLLFMVAALLIGLAIGGLL